MIRLTIDGREITVPEGTMVVDAASTAGIDVPIYCYHQALGSLGACRICLVEIEKMPKLMTACTTAVAEGMVVHTKGPAVEKGRKGILEFLLINHPLDCPICDKGGECFLQDYAFYYGPGKNRFEEAKIQRQKDYPINAYVLLDQERCVLCQRCVRFMGEYVGEEQLKLDGRGVHTVVATATGLPATSPFTGNVIDLCPVGALLSEPYHFKARPWNIEREESFCSQCPVGCPSSITGRDGRIVRMEGRPVPDNWGWLCDHGRFTYDFGYHPARLLDPLVDGQVATMARATQLLGERLKAIIAEHGPDAVGVLSGGIHTVEEEYALARFSREVLGTSRLGLAKPVAGDLPMGLLGTFGDLEQADTVLLLGVDPYEAVPVVHLKLRDARKKHPIEIWGLGERILTRDTLPGHDIVVDCGGVAAALAQGLALASDARDVQEAARLVKSLTRVPASQLEALGEALLSSERVVVLWDGVDPDAAAPLVALARARGDRPTHVLPAYGPSSWMGAWRAGIPCDYGSAAQILEDAAAGRIQALVLWGADPGRDFPEGDLAAKALERCPEVFYAGWFPPQSLETMAIVLPTAAWAEIYGTYVNMEGRLQVAKAAANAPGQSRPTPTLLTSVARAFGKALRFHEDWDPFDQVSGDLLTRPHLDHTVQAVRVPHRSDADGMAVITGVEVSVSHAPSEISERTRQQYPVRMNPDDLARLGVNLDGGPVSIRSGSREFNVGVRADRRIPVGRVFVPRGLDAMPVNRLDGATVIVQRQEEVATR